MKRSIIALILFVTIPMAASPALAADETVSPRPRILPALYATYAALQVYDVYSTRDHRVRAPLEDEQAGSDRGDDRVK